MRYLVLRLALALTCLISAPSWAAERAPVDFTNDVLPILSKYSCNSGGCHGKAIGQNGFKLSLFGFDPHFDYAAIVHEGQGRRISPIAPDDSLLLRKAAGGTAHGGGVRFATDSPPYQLLKSWIEQGLPWGADDAPRATRIEVTPAALQTTGKGSHDLKVVAHYSDGSQRDVTSTARYDSQHPDFLSVSFTGQIETLGRQGEGDVMIRYGDLVASARVAIPWGDKLPDDVYASFQPKGFIDEHVLTKWRAMHIAPSPSASDEVYIRRLFLDTLGTLPAPQEVRDFVADTAADKRDKLVDTVLERPEYADYWTHRWSDILRNRVGDSNAKDNTLAFTKWIRQSLVDNKPYDKFVREIVTVSGKRSEHPQMDWYRQAINQQVRVEDASQAFLGLRVSCANCHNHPFENISQTDYWRFAAFFAKVDAPSYGEVNEIKFKEDGEVKHPRTDQPLTPQAFGGQAYVYVKGEDPRVKLVDWMTSPENPYFAKALCNRVWGHYLGVGLVDPVDDLRATNPPSNPELLAALSKDFVEHQFDLKHLSKTILKSQVYGLAADPTEQNKADTRNYARHYPRRLPPHVLLDAIGDATGSPVKFDDYPDIKRAILLPNEKGRSEFLDMFGRSQRDTPCECETSLAPNIGQVMYLLHSDEIQRKITSKDGVLAKLLADSKPTPELVEALFLRTLSRRPTAAEATDASEIVDKATDKKQAAEDLLWVLLNSQEFLFNH